MAIIWREKMGEMTIKKNEKEFKVSIHDGNCLAVFNYFYTDENGQDMVSLYFFIADEEHAKRMTENGEKLFWDEVADIRLNVANKNAMKLMKLCVKNGYDVTCYYQK